MENKPENVFEKLDSIKDQNTKTQEQNKEIITMLGDIQEQQKIIQQANILYNQQNSNRNVLKEFAIASKKEYIWFGNNKQFDKAKNILLYVGIFLIVWGILSTVVTSVSIGFYSTFTLFENIILLLDIKILRKSLSLEKIMTDVDLKEKTFYNYLQDETGLWYCTNKEKGLYKLFRRLSYIAIVLNVIYLFSVGNSAPAIIFEIIFLILVIAFYFARINLDCMYGNFILYSGKNLSRTRDVTIVYDTISKKVATIEEFKEKFKFLFE